MKQKNFLDRVATHPIQTAAWRDFRASWGNEIIETDWGMMTVHSLPILGKFAIFFRCPKVTKTMIKSLQEIGKKHALFFIKLEPNAEYDEKDISLLKKHNSVKGRTIFTPTTFVIDLKKTKEELMQSFSSKTRYNIRYAEKKGVSVEIDNSQKAFKRYLELMEETVKRQRFYAHNRRYHTLMWQTMHKASIAELLVAKYKERIISAWILFSWNNTLYYPYGASTFDNKNLQANSAMMWGAILYGKEKGLTTFDLWGREEGKGFTRFKEGFSPRVKRFTGSWDLVIDGNSYLLFVLADLARFGYMKIRARLSTPEF